GLAHLHPLFLGGAAREGGRDQEERAREPRDPHCAALYRVYALNGNGPCEIVGATASGPLSSRPGNGSPPSCPDSLCSSCSWRSACCWASSPRWCSSAARALGFDRVMERWGVAASLRRSGAQRAPSGVLGLLAFWAIFLFFAS